MSLTAGTTPGRSPPTQDPNCRTVTSLAVIETSCFHCFVCALNMKVNARVSFFLRHITALFLLAQALVPRLEVPSNESTPHNLVTFVLVNQFRRSSNCCPAFDVRLFPRTKLSLPQAAASRRTDRREDTLMSRLEITSHKSSSWSDSVWPSSLLPATNQPQTFTMPHSCIPCTLSFLSLTTVTFITFSPGRPTSSWSDSVLSGRRRCWLPRAKLEHVRWIQLCRVYNLVVQLLRLTLLLIDFNIRDFTLTLFESAVMTRTTSSTHLTAWLVVPNTAGLARTHAKRRTKLRHAQ